MNAISTKLQMLSLNNIHVFISGKVGSARKKKAKIRIGIEKEVNTATMENYWIHADRQDNDLDPEASAKLEQAKEQAYLPLREKKGEGRAEGKGKFLVRSTCLRLEKKRKLNAMLTVKKDTGHTISNAQCPHPVFRRIPRRMQLE